MKRINAQVNSNDRVVISTAPGRLHFYYKEAGQGNRVYLYTSDFSGSVFAFFRNGGRTIGELYRFNGWHNPKLAKVMERLPRMIEYAVTEAGTQDDWSYTEREVA